MRKTPFTILTLLLLLLGITESLGQTPLYTFKFDLVSSKTGEGTENGTGHFIIYDDTTVEFYGKGKGDNIFRYTYKIQTISTGLDDSLFNFYSDDGDKDSKRPFVLLSFNGDFVSYNENDKWTTLKQSDGFKKSNPNTSVYDNLRADYIARRKVFSNFLSRKDIELPLKINGYLSSYSTTFSAKGGYEVYSVRTKTGKLVEESGLGDYTVSSDSYWASVTTKTNAAFELTLTPNYTGVTRKAIITVSCKDVSSTMTVTQPSSNSLIKRVWAEHNVRVGMVKGMKIHVDFEVVNSRGKQGFCAAYFYFENGNKLMDYNMQYRAIDGQVSTSVPFVPSYDESTFTDVELFMPYSELHVSGAANLKFHVEVQIGGQSTSSDDVSFQLY